MDQQVRTELEDVALAALKQDASLTALLITVAELLRLEGEQLEAFLERYAIHQGVQFRALSARLMEKYPDLAGRILPKTDLPNHSPGDPG